MVYVHPHSRAVIFHQHPIFESLDLGMKIHDSKGHIQEKIKQGW